MNKRQVERDQRAIAKGTPKTKTLTQSEPEHRYHLAEAKAEKQLNSCDDSANLISEFVLIRRVIQHLLTDGGDRRSLADWLKLEASLATSILSTGLQLRILVPAGQLRDAAILMAGAAERAFDTHAPEAKVKAVDWLKGRLGETLLQDEERGDELIDLPEARQIYTFSGTASPNLSLSGSLKLLRFLIQGALDNEDWSFALKLIKQCEATARTQILLAKTEGLLVSKEASSRMAREMTGHVGDCLRMFAPEVFNEMIDDIRVELCGAPTTNYLIQN